MSLRKSDYWMLQVDERILEHLDREGWATPSIMARERGFAVSEGFIRERCEFLQFAGLIYPIHGDMYDLTTDALLYLDGDLDAEHLPRPTVDRVLRG